MYPDYQHKEERRREIELTETGFTNLISEIHIILNVLLLPRQKDDVQWRLPNNRFACLLSSCFVAVTVHCSLPPLRHALLNDTYKTWCSCLPLPLSLSHSLSLSLHIFLVLCLDAKATHDLSTNSVILLTEKFSLTISQMLFFSKVWTIFCTWWKESFWLKISCCFFTGDKLMKYSILLLYLST